MSLLKFDYDGISDIYILSDIKVPVWRETPSVAG